MSLRRNLLITGVPGIGKTTLIKKLSDRFKSQYKILGFYTEEVRQNGTRIGFDVIDLKSNAKRAPLARIDTNKGPRVGKYFVNVQSFENLVVPIFDEIFELISSQSSDASPETLVIIDEIGKMEMFSELFRNAIRRLYNTAFRCESLRVLATIPIHNNILEVQQLRQRQDNHEITVTHANRHKLVDDIVQMLVANALK